MIDIKRNSLYPSLASNKERDVASKAVLGLWKNRKDMVDSVKWVNCTREGRIG